MPCFDSKTHACLHRATNTLATLCLLGASSKFIMGFLGADGSQVFAFQVIWWFSNSCLDQVMVSCNGIQVFCFLCCVGQKWVFPKIMVPPNHPILMGFSIINHPFWGTPIFGNTQMARKHLCFRTPRRFAKCIKRAARAKQWEDRAHMVRKISM